MLLSMTGFGRVKLSWKNKTIIVEIRSLNSKIFDLRTKTPQNYRNKEADIRKILSEKFERGKVDLVLDIQCETDEPENLGIPRISSSIVMRLFLLAAAASLMSTMGR